MQLEQSIKDKISLKVQETVQLINSYYKINMPVPPIYYDLKGTTAGVAKYATMSVHFNVVLLLQNLEDFIATTVPHEVCHIGVMYKALKDRKTIPKAHGAEWKLMMRVVGVPARRCHSYDVTDVKKATKQFEYNCHCNRPIIVGLRVHNKVKQGYIYKCKKCQQVLKNGQMVINTGFKKASPNGTTKVRDQDE